MVVNGFVYFRVSLKCTRKCFVTRNYCIRSFVNREKFIITRWHIVTISHSHNYEILFSTGLCIVDMSRCSSGPVVLTCSGVANVPVFQTSAGAAQHRPLCKWSRHVQVEHRPCSVDTSRSSKGSSCSDKSRCSSVITREKAWAGHPRALVLHAMHNFSDDHVKSASSIDQQLELV